MDHYKVHWVVDSSNQELSDNNKFATTVKWPTVHMMATVCAHTPIPMYHADVYTAFLNAPL
ncbi:hypothetical protein HK096_005871 [Nowakowskiella sp. JEL0078]|nr:hypothetical protein HK096_005871 [Nowakowskiella sp. JEL0078]